MEHYLILHKVRGVAAFDVAQKMEMGDEIWWITSTYGHRAYPYWHKEIDASDIPPMPEDCPEHFEVSAAPKGKGKVITGLLEKLGLVRPLEPAQSMKRRDW